MLQQDELNVTDVTRGVVVGELKGSHRPLPYLKPGVIVCLFEGVDVALDYVQAKMPTAKREASSSDRGRGGFNAFETYEEAMTTFRSHPEQVVKFDPSELRIKDDSEAGTNVDYDVTGDYIDMGRYMEGVPESWGSMHNGNARNRRANIVIDLNQIYSISHEVITHRSERILRLVDALEAGGIRTRLVGIASNDCNHTEVVLKHHAEPLTIADLAVVTHPEFLRRTVFRICEYSKTWSYGYGSAVAFGNALSPETLEGDNVNEITIMIGSNFSNKSQVDDNFDKIEKLLVWEMSKPVPEVSSIKLDQRGIFFNPNGARDESEIRQEGLEAIRAE